MSSADLTMAQPLPENSSDAPVQADVKRAANVDSEQPPSKKVRVESNEQDRFEDLRSRGIAPIKAEYGIFNFLQLRSRQCTNIQTEDKAEDAETGDAENEDSKKEAKKDRRKKNKKKGQNTNRSFGSSKDAKGLCASRTFAPEFSPEECPFGDKCRWEHDLRTYLKEHKREDLTTMSICPVWDVRGKCFSGWKCRLVGTHSTERETEDGKTELVLLEDEERIAKAKPLVPYALPDGQVNIIANDDKNALTRNKIDFTPRANAYNNWLNESSQQLEKLLHGRQKKEGENAEAKERADQTEEENKEAKEAEKKNEIEDIRAQFTQPPFLASEKRRIYFGPETPVLAPLTTQGNMPFRRLCTDLGAQLTYSEMAMSMPLIQGGKSEWTLLKAHESEMLPPTITHSENVVQGYDNSKDLKFGAQIAANKPIQALKATEILSKFTPNLRVIDLNCGCPIDLVYRDGAGSGLLDHHSKLEKMIRGMNAVSQEIPITVKIRLGTRDNQPTAYKLVERLILGGYESSYLNCGPPGAAAITLHGRSRQQRYTKSADWGYIAETAALIKRLNKQTDLVTDTVREPDARYQPNGGKTYFLGNGDCYSHFNYDDHINNAGVDSVMVARGALIKPWIFEEIQTGQYLDKSASERLAYVEKFAKYGLEAWGSDEHGVGTTRRFLMEWLSFAYRYVPIGLLEYLPPNIQDRPPAWQGRNELETLMGSGNYKDWIKITEMFLGPSHPDFKFQPKHKSNAYDDEAEG
ncbi:tRNA-dihydrouridine(47) synthase [Penicillium taxi]|uniref:tRNA-dihydrouridine(47) synthase n=1 Tax=Penicillium taxi TaxID=168475 RepID=UPI002544F4EB|nr:tRNA-dihydrouridine(47) synthase [Penicillium taxi]KAJ5901711.1 tRNA-dihydrouridine(47) synthase [Penicillium taxi]